MTRHSCLSSDGMCLARHSALHARTSVNSEWLSAFDIVLLIPIRSRQTPLAWCWCVDLESARSANTAIRLSSAVM
ncbi:hypothetical protein [Xanthomonas cucurbitae]|uniref:Uncharacterized protein n=1 Tax=Xanthomonas cucurbitae TaxID=56453 RepID=A0ABY7YCC1_9XANT|nr:hypothetical protein [Xanthomonas cucurbitae]WDM67576.1 hypothetical protein K6981_19355 [Xanthomonas cucurbitae]WDM71452.1 hypothetical protein K6978_19320 [Xanthomonas cucurbitae]WDM75572.1 hypothetical protein K6982_00460 [Xanthomonas cucurbitae]WDM79278.1 hypothetical protein K6980_00435 [Xanthomonas cucurbitae]WDM82964.1 hypothetical protein K6979_00440 [Xanthomonas cucurbitae]